MKPATENRRSITPGALAYLLLLALSIALIRPFVNAGVSDDFSFIRSAKDFADTGRFVYNGWSSPILGWMIPFGALFIKLFGFSFTTVRIGSFIIAAVNGLLLQWLLLRIGCTRSLALLGTTAVLFSPISLPETVVFFTDGPGLLTLLVTFVLCFRLLRAESSRATLLWIVLAFFASVLLGTARQLLWMCTLVMVPSAVWLVRKRKSALAWGAICLVLSAAAIALVLHWWNHQPYQLREPILDHIPLSAWARYLFLPLMELLVLLAPVMSLFLLRRVPAWLHAVEVAIALLTVLILRSNPTDLLRLANLDIFGRFPEWVFLVAAAYSLALTARVIYLIAHAKIAAAPGDDRTAITLYELSILIVPFVAAIYILTTTRETFFARYLLPILTALTLWLIKLWLDDPARRPVHAIVPAVLVLLYAASGVLQMHDEFRRTAAALSLTQWYSSQGMPRDQLEAGFAFDGWYQIQRTGYINDSRIKVPAGHYEPHWLPPNIALCHDFFLAHAPSIHPIYGIGESFNPCFTGPELHTVTYNAWLAPHKREVFIARYAPPYAVPAR